ncbi:MAG: MBL fold metallo-hydrolase [Clostridia bacterium]|nr:MBL fold metallo-hydrolase [Clostridia bacterium]
MKKNLILSLVALLLVAASLFALTACGEPATTTADNGTATTTPTPGTSGTDDPTVSDKVNFKFFKCGKANATLIRSGDIAILVDTGEDEDEDGNGKQDDGEKILEYLAEKGVTEIDYLIVSQFNKNHYGSVATILEGVTVKKILEPSYTKTGNAYDEYRAALTKAGMTPEVISDTYTISEGDLKVTLYPAKSTTTSAEQDEYYSLAVAVDSTGLDVLIASDIFGARVTELITALNGQKFDILQVPKHGAFNDTVETLIDAVSPKYAVIFASANNPADPRTLNLLTEKNITTYITMNGSVEAKYKNDTLTVKQ